MAPLGGARPLQHPGQSSSHQDRLPHHRGGDPEGRAQVLTERVRQLQQGPHDSHGCLLCHLRCGGQGLSLPSHHSPLLNI